MEAARKAGHHLPPPCPVGPARSGSAQPLPGTAGQLLGRGWRAVEHRGDFVERDREDVVQHERQPLGRRQRVQHHQQRNADRVGQQRMLLRVVVRGDYRVGHVHVEGVFAVGGPGAQHIQADPRHHRGQPASQVLHVSRFRAGQPPPRLLHRVVGLGERAKHPVGDRPQVRPVRLEAPC
jgi:hypothetical protein